MLLRDTAVGLLALLATPVFANEPPRFNIEATCRAAQPLGPEDRTPYEGCMRDENEGRSGKGRRSASADMSCRNQLGAAPELRRGPHLPSNVQRWPGTLAPCPAARYLMLSPK